MITEDLGTGHCHSEGVGWRGEEVEQRDLLGNITEGDNRTVSLDIYWSVLVLRPNCVDRLTISTVTGLLGNGGGDAIL